MFFKSARVDNELAPERGRLLPILLSQPRRAGLTVNPKLAPAAGAKPASPARSLQTEPLLGSPNTGRASPGWEFILVTSFYCVLGEQKNNF